MKSYSRGPAGTLIRKPIGDVFLDTARRFPDRAALVVSQTAIRLTWGELAHKVECCAAALRALGLQPGDRVGVWATNCEEWLLLQFATALAGIVLVNVNPAYRAHELAYVLKKSRMKVMFLHERDSRTHYSETLAEARVEQALALRHVIRFNSPDWDGFMREPDGLSPEVDAASPANMQYTSGTTGQPKGVLLTHTNIVNNAQFVSQYIKLTSEDRLCLPVPLFHCFGCVAGTLSSAVTGAAIVLPAPTFSPVATMQAIAQERCTAVYGVPAMFIAELNHMEFPRFDFSSLRTGIMAGAPCPIEIMRRVVNEMHCPEMVVAYGQTESSPVITMCRVDDSVEQRCTTAGCALPETEVRIAAPDGSTIPVGEQGELLTRGYLVMPGYDGEPEATAKSIDKDGWLHTGDLALMQPDGYFRITGRAKDLIIRGGENISPREIEEFLYTHPAVADATVVGLPDENLGEIVAVWIRLKEGQVAEVDEIREFCRSGLAHFKVPQYVRFVDEFPMTLSGKVQKFKIRAVEIEERGLQKAAGVVTA